MVKSEKQRETISIIAAIVIHLLILLSIPEFKTKIENPISRDSIMTIRANFIEVDSKTEDITEKKIDTDSKKSSQPKSEQKSKIKTEHKMEKNSKKSETVLEKVKYSEEMLPVINLNKERIKFEDYERSEGVRSSSEKIKTIGVKDDIFKDKSEKISLKESSYGTGTESNGDYKKAEVEEKGSFDNGIGKGYIKNGASDTGSEKTGGAPGGMKMQIVDGDGEAIWDKKNKEPEYPEKAQRNGWTGKVTLLLTVDSEGIVKKVVVEEKSGYFDIDISTEKAAKTWRIHIVRKGIRVAGVVRIPYIFDLRK